MPGGAGSSSEALAGPVLPRSGPMPSRAAPNGPSRPDWFPRSGRHVTIWEKVRSVANLRAPGASTSSAPSSTIWVRRRCGRSVSRARRPGPAGPSGSTAWPPVEHGPPGRRTRPAYGRPQGTVAAGRPVRNRPGPDGVPAGPDPARRRMPGGRGPLVRPGRRNLVDARNGGALRSGRPSGSEPGQCAGPRRSLSISRSRQGG